MTTMNFISHLRARTEGARRRLRPACLTALGGVLLLAVLPDAIAADGPISATQEALKREALYTGEPTGVLDGPTRTALRRYQVLHALPVSGEIDGPTLQALEKSAAPSATPAPVEVPPSPAAEAPAPAPQVVEGDRQFLRQVESTGTPPPAAPEDVTPPPADIPIKAPVPPSPAPPAKTASAKVKPGLVKKHPVDKPREETVRVERAHPAGPEGSPVREPFLEPTPRQPVARFAPGSVATVERESDADITAPSGVKVTRTTTTTTDRDGRTRVQEKRAATVEDAPVPEVVNPPPAPRAMRPNFFSRLFHGSSE